MIKVPHLIPRNVRELKENQDAANNAYLGYKRSKSHRNNSYPEQSHKEKTRRVEKMLKIAAKHSITCDCINCKFFATYTKAYDLVE